MINDFFISNNRSPSKYEKEMDDLSKKIDFDAFELLETEEDVIVEMEREQEENNENYYMNVGDTIDFTKIQLQMPVREDERKPHYGFLLNKLMKKEKIDYYLFKTKFCKNKTQFLIGSCAYYDIIKEICDESNYYGKISIVYDRIFEMKIIEFCEKVKIDYSNKNSRKLCIIRRNNIRFGEKLYVNKEIVESKNLKVLHEEIINDEVYYTVATQISQQKYNSIPNNDNIPRIINYNLSKDIIKKTTYDLFKNPSTQPTFLCEDDNDNSDDNDWGDIDDDDEPFKLNEPNKLEITGEKVNWNEQLEENNISFKIGSESEKSEENSSSCNKSDSSSEIDIGLL